MKNFQEKEIKDLSTILAGLALEENLKPKTRPTLDFSGFGDWCFGNECICTDTKIVYK